MGYLSSLFSMIFFLAALLSLYFGYSVIRLDTKSCLNRIFLLITISLAIWSFGFAMSNSTDIIKDALYWRRFSAIGWTTFFALVLQFVIVALREKTKQKYNWYLLAINIPALINLFVFSFSNELAKTQYNLVKINSGWANIAPNNSWDLFFYITYAIYLASIIILVWKLKSSIADEVREKQANILLLATLIVIIPGVFIDFIANSYLINPLPQVGSIFALIPIAVMYRAVVYHNMFDVALIVKSENIITVSQQKKIFTFFSGTLFAVALVTFFSEYFSVLSDHGRSIGDALSKSALIFFLSIGLFFIQKLKKEELKSTLTTIFLVTSIPIVNFQYSLYASSTAWVYPLILIISSLLFNNRIMLNSTVVVAVITQILAWVIDPLAYLIVDRYEYVFRIMAFVIAYFLGSYINRVYLKKNEENEYQISFQKMISDISYEFVSLNQENYNKRVNHLLEEIGRFFNVDRTYLFSINHNNDTMTYSNEWCNVGIKAEVGTIEEIPLDVFPWWIKNLEDNNLVYIEDVAVMPADAKEEQDQLIRQEVQSLVSVPVIVEGRIEAFIGIDSVAKKKVWTSEQISMLYIMANILSSGIVQVRADKEIEFMAYYDNLTKLPNRFLFEDRVNQAINLAKRSSNFISVIFIDLDSFKSVNDTIGHKGGDELLIQVAERLKNCVRKTDTVARFGGDEFMLMINNIKDHTVIQDIADKVMENFSEPFRVFGQDFLVTASAGVAIYPVDGENSAALVKNADIAMYKAKEKGRNRYALCTQEIKDEVQMSMELSNDLYRALDGDEFELYYQPQVDLATKQIAGVEALIRWNHPTKGMINPGTFIPIAEKNSLINGIGDWVLETACRQNKQWQDQGLPKIEMAVNLSAVQMINPNIAEKIENIIKESGLDPKYVELEITESIAIKETDYVLEVLNKLKKIGVSIAIDDFGTEYSSLSRLKDLPIDRIKIDMQFIQGIESNEKDKAITMIIINLAKSLDLNVLAEGVETNEQLDYLNEQMCDYVQGYYYYRPMPASEMEEILKDMLT